MTNISALKLQPEKRLYSRVIPIAGPISCLGLVVFLPLEQWLWTAVLVASGVVYMVIRKNMKTPRAPESASFQVN